MRQEQDIEAMTAMLPAALYVAKNSIYKQLLGDENCWDAARDARTFDGKQPIIAHPPCQDYCRLAHMYKRQPDRAALAKLAIEQVRTNGGVLEHPANSTLWKETDLPIPDGFPDKHGGIAITVRQFDFGHIANKATWLYICNIPAELLPPLPPRREGETAKLYGRTNNKLRRRVNKEYTPQAFAEWLIAVASLADKSGRMTR